MNRAATRVTSCAATQSLPMASERWSDRETQRTEAVEHEDDREAVESEFMGLRIQPTVEKKQITHAMQPVFQCR